MSQRSFTSRATRPVLILGVSVAILSLGLSACSKQKSGSPNPSQGTGGQPRTGGVCAGGLPIGGHYQPSACR